jgi:hypothetical protein
MSLDTHGYEVSNSLSNLDMREPASGSRIRGPDPSLVIVRVNCSKPPSEFFSLVTHFHASVYK